MKDVDDKILSITNLATNAALNANINGIKDEIPSISDLATATALTAFENKIPDVSDLVKKQIMMQKYQKLKNTFYYF